MPRAKGVPRKAGRKPTWGKRSAVSIRWPVEHRARYEREAAQLGISLNEYVIRFMAARHDLTDQDETEGTQQELKIGA